MGLAPTTQQGDLEAVKHLAQYDRRTHDQLRDEDLRQSCRFLLNEKNVAARTLPRPWPVVDLVRPRHSQKLPVVLSLREVRSPLAWAEHPNARMCLQMSCA